MERRTFLGGAGAAVVVQALDPQLLASEPSAGRRVRTSLDSDWQFWKGDLTGAENPSFDDTAWRTVRAP